MSVKYILTVLEKDRLKVRSERKGNMLRKLNGYIGLAALRCRFVA